MFKRRVDAGFPIENVTISETFEQLTQVQMVALKQHIPTLLVDNVEPWKWEDKLKRGKYPLAFLIAFMIQAVKY